jgi:hypothetical protein
VTDPQIRECRALGAFVRCKPEGPNLFLIEEVLLWEFVP